MKRNLPSATERRDLKDVLYEQVARIGKAAASPKRLEIIELLCQSAKTVDTLAQEVGISMKLASAHLKELKAARLVEADRQGRNILYRLSSPEVARLWVNLRIIAEDRLFELQTAVLQLRENTNEWTGNSRKELLQKARAGDVVVIDVRPQEEFDAGHLPHARSMPLSTLRVRLAELPRNKLVIAYCRGPFCFLAADAVALLRSKGYKAMQLREGVAEWSTTAA